MFKGVSSGFGVELNGSFFDFCGEFGIVNVFDYIRVSIDLKLFVIFKFIFVRVNVFIMFVLIGFGGRGEKCFGEFLRFD